MDRFRNVLVYVEGAEPGGAAFDRALELCRRSGAKLEILAVTPELSVYLRYPQFSYPSLEETLSAEAESSLAALAARAREAGVDVQTKVRHGKPFLEVTREALAGGHDLVMLTAGEEGSRHLAGSTAMRLFQVCPAPVWAVRSGHSATYGRILAAVDPSVQDADERGLNGQILDAALAVAAVEGARVDVLHAWSGGPGAGPRADEIRSQVEALARTSLDALAGPYALPEGSVHLTEGEPAEAITSFVDEHRVDLLVMGTVVRTGVAGMLIGNTAEKALGRVGCSVLALKPAGFRSPVEAS